MTLKSLNCKKILLQEIEQMTDEVALAQQQELAQSVKVSEHLVSVVEHSEQVRAGCFVCAINPQLESGSEL